MTPPQINVVELARESQRLATKYGDMAKSYDAQHRMIKAELEELKGGMMAAHSMSSAAMSKAEAAERVARRVEERATRIEDKLDRALERAGVSSPPPRSPIPSVSGRESWAGQFEASRTGNFRKVPPDVLDGIAERFKELQGEVQKVHAEADALRRQTDVERAEKLAVQGALATRQKADADLRSRLAWIGGIVLAAGSFVGWLISNLLHFVH